jgi:predicted phage terminase large subunit-like protein
MSLENSLSVALANPEWALNELDRIDCEESLGAFLRGGWRYIDPSPYIHGWHLDAIAEHLEAVTDGQIRRLIINVPPRHSKSSLVSVAWPAWTWAQERIGPLSGPQVQFLSASYAQPLSTRDALKSRRLIQSPWFQQKWGSRFSLTGDQNAKMRYENDKGGYRIATSVNGALTGEGGSCIIIDDPLNATDVTSSMAAIDSAVSWWDEAMSTRLNDPKTGAYVIIMQRLHESDLTGHILSANHDDWVHLCLPARYEADRHCSTVIGWEDPRAKEGDGAILAPSRFDDASLKRLEAALGPYGSAGQLQQRPEPRGGGIFKREWWQLWGNEDDPLDIRNRTFPACEYIVASLDPAYTEKEENDYSAVTVWGVFRDERSEGNLPKIILLHAWRDRLAIHDLVQKCAEICKRFKADRLLIESKASGISVAQELRRLFAGELFGVQLVDPKGRDKEARAYAVQPLFADEMVYAPYRKYSHGEWGDREWCDMVITEMASFPRAPHDDLCDSATMALSHLRRIGLAVHETEVKRELAEEMMFKPEPKPLYGAI